jgi:hypothetical protein
MPFYTADWLSDPELSKCSPSTRGIYADLLAAMWQNNRSGIIEGTAEELSRVARCSPAQLIEAAEELERTKAADVNIARTKSADVTPGIIFVTVINRRMYREAKSRNNTRLRVQRHRCSAPCNASDTGYILYSISTPTPPNPVTGPVTEPPAEGPPEPAASQDLPPAEDIADPLSSPGDRAAFDQALEALSAWAALPKPIGIGRRLQAMWAEDQKVLRAFMELQGEGIQGRLAGAARGCVRDGISFRDIAWACGCAKRKARESNEQGQVGRQAARPAYRKSQAPVREDC